MQLRNPLLTPHPVLNLERSAGDIRHDKPYFNDGCSVANSKTRSSFSSGRSSTKDPTYPRVDSERRADKVRAIVGLRTMVDKPIPWKFNPRFGDFVYQPSTDQIIPRTGRPYRRPLNIPIAPLSHAIWEGFQSASSPPVPASGSMLHSASLASLPWKFNPLFGEFFYLPSTDLIIRRYGQPQRRPPNYSVASLSYAIWPAPTSGFMLRSGPGYGLRPPGQSVTPAHTGTLRPRGQANDPRQSRVGKGESRDTVCPNNNVSLDSEDDSEDEDEDGSDDDSEDENEGDSGDDSDDDSDDESEDDREDNIPVHLSRAKRSVRNGRSDVRDHGRLDIARDSLYPALRVGPARVNAVTQPSQWPSERSWPGSPNDATHIGSELMQAQASMPNQARLPDTFEEPTISGRLEGVDVSVFPDTGAAANFISLSYAVHRGLTVNKNFKARVKVGNGLKVSIVGTTSLQFSFAGEQKTHNLTFHILRQSVHDVILGSLFLRLSETFTRFKHRVRSKIREAVSHCKSFLGSQQYVNGLANGVGVNAVPDTGADVCVMSASFAESNGFEIDDDEQQRISLQFADESEARVRGVVKNMAWRFGADEQIHHTDVYVLSSLTVDLVLGYGFLCRTKAFDEHGHDFWHGEDHEQEFAWRLCVIRVLKRAMKAAGMDHSPHAADKRWQMAKAGEMDLYRNAREEAQALGLSEDDTVQYLRPHVARWQRFLATRPAHSIGSMSISPSSPSSGFAASSQAGGAQVQIQSHTLPTGGTLSAGRFSMDWFGRKARGNSSVAV